jgi:hypothetical protein
MSWIISHAISAVKSETPHDANFCVLVRHPSQHRGVPGKPSQKHPMCLYLRSPRGRRQRRDALAHFMDIRWYPSGVRHVGVASDRRCKAHSPVRRLAVRPDPATEQL